MSSTLAPPATGRLPALERPLAWVLRHLDWLALVVLLTGVGSPQAAPTGTGYVMPGSYQSIWTVRLGGANLFELACVTVLALWVVRRLSTPARESRFDVLVLAVGVAVLGFEAVALARHWQQATFLLFDVEHLLVPFAGYLLVTRFVRDARRWRVTVLLVAAAICLRAAELVLRYGILGSTEFGTSAGRIALLITEDGLLLVIPALLAYGALIERRLRILGSLVAVAFIGAVIVVDLLSLRRGALIFIVGALLVRTVVSVRRRTLALLAVGAAVVAGALVAFGPAAPLLKDVSYTVRSTFLQTKDASTSQRQNELTNFRNNVRGLDWPLGRGLGVVWRAIEPGPVDAAAFGSKETPYLRIGWHVYSLDWAYKFGLVGLALLVLFVFLVARRARRLWRAAPASQRNVIAALAISFPIFALLLFTNLRVGLFAGLTLGLLSKGADLWGDQRLGTASARE